MVLIKSSSESEVMNPMNEEPKQIPAYIWRDLEIKISRFTLDNLDFLIKWSEYKTSLFGILLFMGRLSYHLSDHLQKAKRINRQLKKRDIAGYEGRG